MSRIPVLRAAEYAAQVSVVYHNPDVQLPTFSTDELVWLLEPSLKGNACAEGPQSIGVSLSVHRDAHPDVLVFSHKKRLLLVQLLELDDEEQEGIHPGMELLKNLLLCTGSESVDIFRNTKYAGTAVQLASLSAAEIAYLLYNTFEVHSQLLDLELLAPMMGCRKVLPFNSMCLIRTILGAGANAIFALAHTSFQVHKGKVQLENTFLAALIESVRSAIGAYECDTFFTRASRTSLADGMVKRQECLVDTQAVPPKLLAYLARFEAVEKAMMISKPKTGSARLRVVNRGNGIDVKVAKDGKSFEVTNEQYKSRLTRNSRQLLNVSLVDEKGVRRNFSARTVATSGRTSSLHFLGKDSSIAIEKLGAPKHANVAGSTVGSVEVRGREDHSAGEIDGMKWRRQLMTQRVEKVMGTSNPESSFDPSRLICPFLLGDQCPQSVDVVDKQTIKLMDRPEQHKYDVVSKREAKGTLNTSQARAAKAIMSPLRGRHSMVEQRDVHTQEERLLWGDDDFRQQERLILIHGPPGTGKTSLITACCEQWVRSCTNIQAGTGSEERVRDTVYACCQSNVAVKNIAESFCRAGINFKVGCDVRHLSDRLHWHTLTLARVQIIVSPNFYVEWHEDLYADIQHRLVRTDELPSSAERLLDVLDGCDVLLATLSFLSSPKVVEGDCPLFRLRPMRLLFVDEASQIHLRAYPHLFDRFGRQVARIVFLGDDCQLPPFQGEEIIDAGLSVFELPHLRKAAFLLDTCYRLAGPVAEFISANVYGGRLQYGTSNYHPKGGLLDCVSFIDVESSQEERQGTSRVNHAEVEMVARLVSEYRKRGGAMSRLKVLSTYDAQRDALEEALKRQGLSGASDIVFSVDSFQGRESDYIVLSLVKDGRPTRKESRWPTRDGAASVVKFLQPGLGFLSNDRRINVALTRAKRGIIVVSNRRFIIDTAAETLVGKLQVEMQWCGEGGESHWSDEDDIRNSRFPQALFASLPAETQIEAMDEQFRSVGLDVVAEASSGWD